ncbi:MAG: nucleotidyl transferase AbiEii/AbiGii toxin family protein [Bryobacteraceae bacterium]
MIERDFIVAWRQRAPWPTDAQVEQDLVLSRALVEIFNHPLLSRELAFRGGTALHKFFLPKPARYSEDIDLVQIAPGPIGPVMTALRETLDPWLGAPKRSQSEGRMTFIYRFESELPPIVPLRVKIEVNTREHFTVLGHVTQAHKVDSGWFRGTAEVRSYRLEELLATKLRALFQRKKGRDLFDLGVALEDESLDADALVACFERYMTHGEAAVSRAQFEENLLAKLAAPEFTADLPVILSADALSKFDLQRTGDLILGKLVARLKGDPWQGRRTPRA